MATMEYTEADIAKIKEGADPNKLDTKEPQDKGEPSEQQAKPSKYETKARKDGWTTLEEWESKGRDPEDWVDAPEFVRRGELMDRIKGQTKALKNNEKRINELNDAIKVLGEHNKKIAKVEYERALKTLKEAKAEAMADQDHQAVVEIDERMDTLKEQAKATEDKEIVKETPQDNDAAPPLPHAVKEWLDAPENKWYLEDSAMRAAADALATEYGKLHFDPAVEPEDQPWDKMLDEVTDQLHEKFPGYFGEEEPEPTEQKAPRRTRVAEPGKTGQRGAKKGTKLKLSDLSPEERSAHDEFVHRQKIMSSDEYLAQLDALNNA